MLATAGDHPWSRRLRDEVEAVARMDRHREHVLVDDAEEADVILFVDAHQHPGDWRLQALRHHRLVRAFPEKVFVYDERDLPRDSLPGVYVSMPCRSFDARRHRAFAYVRLVNDTRAVADVQPDLLFSFQGRRVGRVREDVLALSHPRAVIRDSSDQDFFSAERSRVRTAETAYRELLGRSKFVLCPRGAGTSSLRLFEVLAAGRVPVVLSDDWVAPAGIDWDACSVRVSERDATAVARRLEAAEPEWPALADAARRTYDRWFAPDVWFHHAVEHCCELRDAGASGTTRQWVRTTFWRDGARHWKRRLLVRGATT